MLLPFLLSVLGPRGRVRSTSCFLHTSIFYNDVYEVSLPPNHRFPMNKYRIVRESLQRELGNHPNVSFLVSPVATRSELMSTHCPNYIDRYLSGRLTEQEIRRTGFPWSEAHVRRSTSSVGGTVAAMRAVLNPAAPSSISCHVAGGTHHAFYNYGEGYCIFSDIAVAANLALTEFSSQVQRVLIVDLDVHQGNGNAVLFADNPHVFTFSMHCVGNYFSQKQISDLDIELEVGCGDEEYLRKLQDTLSRLFKEVQPQLVFFQAGVDVSKSDRLGKLKLTDRGISERNRIVYSLAKEWDAKLVVTMGGGYPRDPDPSSASFTSIINCHKNVYLDGIKIYYNPEQ